ncbi:enoyl-(Acyl carrier protein) reductase [Hirsutella rhossiliensis]|uniref:Enoyl-(Acyl carrier protein) reductase domain-containing protein n=1 Tax=Hirsutella rhossiliensis TaxID=111463 RepID=A0A9P8SDZ0_9HYPO|nr:enoyl-(Acyl carrier protein) reductase domain-containing protein [Hirsutella rhossiliensis]KAH0959116.1 enoyl-(Acyl carrier protein) reductase domain-containing protein [Hirsutella rhossiliensis]
MAYSGKCFAVTGGASGIGLATVKLLWSRGATVCISDVNETGLKKLEHDLQATSVSESQSFSTATVDVRIPDQVDAWIAGIVAQYGKLDGAANVAGAPDAGGLLAEKSDDDFDFSIGLNLRGVFNCMRAELKSMGRGASIVNVSSAVICRSVPGYSLYSAAKSGVNALTKCAAKEYGPVGVRVNSVCPGITRTPILDVAKLRPVVQPQIDATALGRWAEPEEMARTIAFLLSDEASFQSGSVVLVDGGFCC